jgi:hypothetical protein
MPRLSRVRSELYASCPADASRFTSAASSASLPLGSSTTPASFTFSSPVIPLVSTPRRLWSFVASMGSADASFRSPVTRSSPTNATVSRLLFHASTESNRTPNHALQRTAPRVTLAATHRPAAFARPAPAMSPQPSRRAPQSLSLGSLGVMRKPYQIPNVWIPGQLAKLVHAQLSKWSFIQPEQFGVVFRSLRHSHLRVARIAHINMSSDAHSFLDCGGHFFHHFYRFFLFLFHRFLFNASTNDA